MDAKQVKVGMEVSISKNIDITTQFLSSNPTMKAMAGDQNTYKVESVNTNGVVLIKGFIWRPEDLISAEEGYLDPLPLKGKIVTFNPCDL